MHIADPDEHWAITPDVQGETAHPALRHNRADEARWVAGMTEDNVVPLRRRQRRRKKSEGDTLCRAGRHRWEVVTESKFDVRQGRLVTLLRCSRCGHERTESR